MAAPVAVEEYPCTWIRLSGKRKKKMPMAEYKNKVSRFAPVKLAFLNMASRTIGEVARASTRANPIMQPKPAIKLPKTRGFLQPSLPASIKPFTLPRSPRAGRHPPQQSPRMWGGAAAPGDRQKRNSYHRRCKRKVDEKCPPPRSMLNQPAAKNGTNRGGDRGKA